MCGTFGFEMDISKATPKDLQAFQRQIEVYKQIHPVVRWGDLYRLWDPFKVTYCRCVHVAGLCDRSIVVLNSLHTSQILAFSAQL
jgi:alpha-galactosidase